MKKILRKVSSEVLMGYLKSFVYSCSITALILLLLTHNLLGAIGVLMITAIVILLLKAIEIKKFPYLEQEMPRIVYQVNYGQPIKCKSQRIVPFRDREYTRPEHHEYMMRRAKEDVIKELVKVIEPYIRTTIETQRERDERGEYDSNNGGYWHPEDVYIISRLCVVDWNEHGPEY